MTFSVPLVKYWPNCQITEADIVKIANLHAPNASQKYLIYRTCSQRLAMLGAVNMQFQLIRFQVLDRVGRALGLIG